MAESNNKTGKQQSGEMGTAENSNDVQNPINTGSKSENADNDGAVAMTRNPTDRGGASAGTKNNVTGSDFDGQVSR